MNLLFINQPESLEMKGHVVLVADNGRLLDSNTPVCSMFELKFFGFWHIVGLGCFTVAWLWMGRMSADEHTVTREESTKNDALARAFTKLGCGFGA
jgi:hypothetical protein